ncbi:MAG: LCP family protein [Candidatus Levybacteria bacterium]|nr:LCP family protein [Candidatus Levybacteria bacterium]
MRKKIFIVIGIFLLIFFGKAILVAFQLSPFFFQLIFNKEIDLKKDQDRVNVLFLGIGGGVHDGPYLTDTIIFASLDANKNKATLVSIPRDLWVVDLAGRINTAYSNAEYKRKGGGIVVSSAVVNKVIRQPVDYVVRVDFNGFVKAVDLLGGISVNVENELIDYQYPISGKENDVCGHTDFEVQYLATASSQLKAFPCRYKLIKFDKGIVDMNGQQALEFVRSRHAKGDEGTDFARSKRQEQVIKAIKDKVFSLNVLFNPSKIVDFYNILRDSIDTNVKEDEFDDFVKLLTKMRSAKIESVVLDYGDELTNRPGLLIHPDVSPAYNNEWVLVPRIGINNFSEVQEYIDCEIRIGKCPITGL